MTGGRCHRRKKMKEVRGEEAEEERPCPDSRVPATIPTNSPENSSAKDVDFLAQARKALSLRSPCDGSDEASLAAVPILPSALAGFLSSQSDSRKKHKKAHSSAGMNMKKNSSSSKSRAPSVWDMNEDYFRDLTMQDIESLSEVSELISGSAASRKCLWIPSVSEGNEDNCGNGNEVAFENDFATTVLDEAVEKVVENGALAEEEAKKEEDGQSMEIDHVEIEGLPRKDRGPTVSEPYRGLEWLLGVRNKVSLTSERPSKKRKLLGVEAGLEKALVACPCDGISSLCHFCSAGNEGSELSRLISCSSCGVSVHRKCYGVQEDNADSSWLCSWCKTKTTESGRDSEYPCVLCPKKGGALKPVSLTDEKDKSLGFAHLFCSQWAPEAYVEDLEKMEPILNVEAVKEVRKKIICNICKVKFGACVRCSHGACRSAFHPLCAREARYRMEVWGRYGCDDVELRAFCLKHSEVQDQSNTSRAGDSLVAGSNPDSVDSLPEKNVGCRNGDDSEVHVVAPGSISDKSSDYDLQGTSLADSRFNDGELGSTDEDISAADLYNFALIFKKLVDRGRIKIEDVASQIGTSEDLLSASLADDTIASDLQLKIARWLKKNVHLSTVQNNRKIGTRSKVSSKAESGAADDSNVVSVSESDIADNVPVKSVTPRRRTKSGARISNDPKLISSAQDREIFSDKESAPSEKADKLVNREQDELSEISTCHAVEQNIAEPEASQVTPAHRNGAGSMAEPSHTIPQEKCQVERLSAPKQDSFSEADGNPTCSVANPVCPNLQTMEMEGASNFYIHPDIQKKLLQMKDGVDLSSHMDGLVEEHRVSLDGLNKHLICDEMRSSTDVSKELAKATESGILELAPEDELEGEIVYFQNKFLSNAASRKTLSDKLISSVAKSLPQELDLARDNSWDSVLVNKYLGELREAKKQGRKERRHKEAQAVLAAATAAAAASSRISSLRKDGDDVSNPESTSGRFGNYSQPIPRAKETLQRVAAPRISLEKHSDSTQSIVDISKEHPRACDICRRSDSLLNPILVCCGCKVAVHLDCYRSVKESTGPWYCELCEELLMSRSSGAPAVNFWEKPYFVAECGLCGGSTGAFRKTSDGQWVHAFCAEWVFESKFRRGQINSVEGMEAVSKAVDLCLICRRRHGVCIKCNYGHCQASFHPWCARSAGFFMNIKSSASKQQHKAYCEKHSVEQRAKAESQKHGAEELKSLKQVRVELERLRLLCERLIKREKLKRELVLCSHDILAMRRDHVARSTLSRRPYLLPDVSSESVTTSLKGHTDDRKSCSEALQRSDDVTVDSTVSVKRRGRASGAMDDRRTEDDCSTPQNQSTTRKTTDRSKFSGKQIPNRPSSVATRNLMDESWKSKVKKQETFGKEMVMTSDQASVKNMLLPKGYAYVPADCLSNEKQQPNQDPGSGEPSDHGG